MNFQKYNYVVLPLCKEQSILPGNIVTGNLFIVLTDSPPTPRQLRNQQSRWYTNSLSAIWTIATRPIRFNLVNNDNLVLVGIQMLEWVGASERIWLTMCVGFVRGQQTTPEIC